MQKKLLNHNKHKSILYLFEKFDQMYVYCRIRFRYFVSYERIKMFKCSRQQRPTENRSFKTSRFEVVKINENLETMCRV